MSDEIKGVSPALHHEEKSDEVQAEDEGVEEAARGREEGAAAEDAARAVAAGSQVMTRGAAIPGNDPLGSPPSRLLHGCANRFRESPPSPVPRPGIPACLLPTSQGIGGHLPENP